MGTRSNGFSLIEVILVITLIAILAALALPQLGTLDRPAHRQIMQAELLRIAQELEQTYSQKQRYQAIELEPFPADSPRYSLRLHISDDGQMFTLQAKPLGDQRDDGLLIIDSSGSKRRYSNQEETYVSW